MFLVCFQINTKGKRIFSFFDVATVLITFLDFCFWKFIVFVLYMCGRETYFPWNCFRFISSSKSFLISSRTDNAIKIVNKSSQNVTRETRISKKKVFVVFFRLELKIKNQNVTIEVIVVIRKNVTFHIVMKRQHKTKNVLCEYLYTNTILMAWCF